MKEKKYLILGIATVLITLIGVTYAYFTTKIIGDRKNVTVDMAKLKIIFTNGDAIEASDVYAEDNLDIVKTFSVENKTKNEYKYNIVIEDLVNTFKTTGYLVYKITSEDGGYNMTEFVDVPKSSSATDMILAYSVSIPAKSIHNYNIEIKYINDEENSQDEDQGATLSGKLYISKGSYPNLFTTILKDNPTIGERTDFSDIFTETTTGTLYKTNKTEDNSDVYYYSGNTTNNWVKFGEEQKLSCVYNNKKVIYVNYSLQTEKYAESESECVSTNICSATADGETTYVVGMTEEECGQVGGKWINDNANWGNNKFNIYWRIIRSNEDGSVRLLYSGTSPDTTEGYIGKSAFNSAFNSNSSDSMYVGYMYGTSGTLESNRTNENDSTIKTTIDTWYEKNLLTNYDKYISKTAIYCNDRSVGEGTYNKSGSTKLDYGGYTRLFTNKTPSYKCGANTSDGLFESTQAIEDKFSASTEGGGNGQLKYPIALMTADEVSFAGGVRGRTLSSPYAWYYTNSKGTSIVGSYGWWTISPYESYRLFHIYDDGILEIYGMLPYANGITVRPSISLDSCVQIKSGNGTPEAPYEIDYDGSCK